MKKQRFIYTIGYGQNPERYPITILTDYDETSGTANYPGENRTAIYEVTFVDTGTYDLFGRVQVGSDGFNDDSFFYGNGFGEKNSTNAGPVMSHLKSITVSDRKSLHYLKVSGHRDIIQ